MKTIYLVLVAIVFLAACQASSNLSEEDIDRLAERLQEDKTEARSETQELEAEPNCRTEIVNYTEKEPYTTTELKTRVEEYVVQEPKETQEPYETTETYYETEGYDEPFDFSGCTLGNEISCFTIICSGSGQLTQTEQLLYLNTCTANSELRQIYCDAGTLTQHDISEIYSCPPLKKTRQVEKTRTVTEYRDTTSYLSVTKYRNVTEPVEVTKYRDVVKSKEETVCE